MILLIIVSDFLYIYKKVWNYTVDMEHHKVKFLCILFSNSCNNHNFSINCYYTLSFIPLYNRKFCWKICKYWSSFKCNSRKENILTSYFVTSKQSMPIWPVSPKKLIFFWLLESTKIFFFQNYYLLWVNLIDRTQCGIDIYWLVLYEIKCYSKQH